MWTNLDSRLRGGDIAGGFHLFGWVISGPITFPFDLALCQFA
jgi:hypothetical protein